MAKGFAIHNAPTDHGGLIPATQFRDSQMGNAFVRAGDGHFCPKCKCWSTVIKSHDHVIIDGKAVAFVGDKLTCGATFNLSNPMSLAMQGEVQEDQIQALVLLYWHPHPKQYLKINLS